MALADFFIGKPGPGSISEALQFHLPVIVECNSKTLPQERYNAEWVTENGYGIVVAELQTNCACGATPAAERDLDEFRRKVDEYSNRALFEVPKILEQCAEHDGDTRRFHHAAQNNKPRRGVWNSPALQPGKLGRLT